MSFFQVFLRNGWSKKKSRALAFLLVFSVSILSVFANVTIDSQLEKRDPIKIRVGFFEFDGYHKIKADGTKTGYGYEFLQMIAPYANFEYEYVGYDKSWAEMQKMLADGEIDLLTSAQKTSLREELFDYSDRCIGFSSTIVTTTPANMHLATSSFSDFQNIRIGMLENNSRNASFDRYAKRHGISYFPIYFETQSQMTQALKDGKIDAIVTSDLRTLGNEIVIAKFDDSPFYAMVKKGNKDLLKRVNMAIELLSLDSPNWIHSLSYKYYNNIYYGKEIVLMPEEKEYLNELAENKTPLTILVNPDRAPYSYFEKKKPKGMFIDLLEQISEEIGFEYEIVECKTVKEYEEAIWKGKAHIVFGCVMDPSTAEETGYHMTIPFHVTALACVTRVNEKKVRTRVAVNEGMSVLNKRYEKLYGDREQVKFHTIKDCMEAVKNGKADCCYAYTYTAAKYVFEDVKGSLAYSPVSDSLTDVGIAVRNEDGPILFHLMNRIAGNLTEDELQTAVANNTNFSYTGNIFFYLIYRKPLYFIFIFLTLSFIIFMTIIVKRNREKRTNLLLLKEGKEKREALELACEAAEKANKAKSDFLSKMSHDIRTPMNAIVGMTAIAQTHVEEPEKVSECLSKITTSSHHLLALINEVLDMSKIESGTFSLSYEKFNISELLNELVEIVTPEIKARKHNLEIHVENLVHENVIGDSLRIQQCFVNIVGNAIKYTSDGGKIDIYVKELESNQSKIGYYEFAFKDNGIGMSKEFLKTIFDPFSRENDSRVDKIQGTGLGLAITKNIINMMDGSINVESERNKGSTFKIMLKLRYQENEISNNSEKSESESKKTSGLDDFKLFDFKGKKLLLVEDNLINREIAREIFEITGITVEEAEDGKIAVEKFSASSENEYDMIFMDIQMPILNGYDAALAIRSLDRNDAKTIPIVAMTANAFTEDIEKAMESGMNDHLAKPLDIGKLASVMQKFLA